MVGSGRSPHTLTRAAAVASRGHSVRIVTLGEVLSDASVDVATRPLPTSLGGAVAAARAFWGAVRRHRPDLLHLHYAGGRLGTLAALSGARPLVVTVMGGDVLPEQHLGGYGRLERRATRRILQQADVILAKADRLRPAIAASGGDERRIETVRWGVDPERFRPDPAGARRLRQKLMLHERGPIVLSSRILQPLYNAHVIVDAMASVIERVPGALLLVSTDRAEPGYRAAVEQRVERLGLAPSVRFLERIPHDAMPGLYGIADVVVSIPSSDGLPQTLFESMACETPAVLGRLAAYSEVVADGETAILTEITPPAVAEAIARVLTSPALRSELGHAARRRVLEVASLPRELDRVEQCYRRALASPQPRRARPLSDGLDLLSLLLR